MKAKLIYPFIILLLALVIMIIRERNNSNKLMHALLSGRNRKRIDSINTTALKSLVFTHGSCIDIKIERGFPLTDNNNKILKFEKIIGSKSKYVYHFDETNCLLCVEKYLPFLKKIADKTKGKNIIIIGSFEKAENLFRTLQKHDLHGIPAYNLHPSFLAQEKISQVNSPYIFRIDSSFQVSQVYIPEKGLPELSELYIKNLSFK